MGLRCLAAPVVLLALAGWLRADLKRARAEPNLEKRSQLALDNAFAAYQAARAAYEKGENEEVSAAAAEMQESVELAGSALKETGKDPRRSPKWFKKAEIQTRDLLRKLDGLQQEMGFSERPLLDKAKAAIQEMHDEVLLGLMEGRRK